MCDCYGEKCHKTGCIATLPVHLGDYDTGREEIEVFCKSHIPKEDCRVFTLTENHSRHFKKGWKMAIRALTDNARMNKNKNYPNLGVEWTTEDR